MTLKKAGISLTLQGKAAYLSGLKSISQQTKLLEAQSKLAVAQLGNNAKIVDTYRAKMKNLGDMQKLASEKTATLVKRQKELPGAIDKIKDSVVQVSKAHSDSAKNTERLKVAYEELQKSGKATTKEIKEAKAAYNASKKETNAYEQELRQLNTELSKHQSELKNLPLNIAKAQTATAELRNEAQRLHAEYRNNGGRLADTAKQWQEFGANVQGVGQKLSSAGDYMTTRFTLPIIAGFGAAVKQASAFHSQIGAMGPLLTNGKPITPEVAAQLNEISKTSRSLAVGYGKDTGELNAGMSELIRNGFTAHQVLGMMPNLLDASVASGENFNDVMKVSSQVLNQFKLRGKNYEETLKNTQRVTDSITFIGNATSAGFRDLGEGMAYIGPVAKSLNMSVEETASLLGILSDNGIEASQGGTALRGALTRLLKPSKQNAKAFEALGISTEYFRKGTLKLPEILDKIKKNTKDWTDEQRAAALATAFGTEAQTAMNALVSAGGDELRKLTKEAENATGATKEIAEAMKKLPEFKYQQLMAQIKDLGIQLGTKLLPTVLKTMEGIGKWIDKFSKLNPKMQDFIVKSGLAVAAIGPMLKLLGSLTTGTGKVIEGIGGLIKWYGKWTTSSQVLGGEIGLLNGLLGGSSATFIALTAAVVAGYGAWKLFGEHAYNAAQAVIDFPSVDGITAEQADSINTTARAYADLDTALDSLSGKTSNYAETVANAVSAIVAEIEKINTNKIEGLDELFKELPPQVAAMYESLAQEEKAQADARIQRAREVQEGINNINKGAADERRGLYASEQQLLRNYGNELAKIQAESLANGSEQAKQLYQVMTADISKMNQTQLLAQAEAAQAQLGDLDYNLQQQKKKIIDKIGDNEISKKMISELETVHGEVKNKLEHQWVHAYAEMSRRAGASTEEMVNNIATATGLAPEKVRAILEQGTPQVEQAVKNMMKPFSEAGREVDKAAEKWNIGISKFAKSKNKLVENLNGSDLTEFMGKVQEMGLTWNDLQLLTKQATVDDNLKDLINKTAEAHGGWDNLLFEEKNAEVKVLGEEELKRIVELFGVDFAGLSDEQKEALVKAKGIKELSDLLFDWEIWKAESPVEAKQAAIETDQALAAFVPLFQQADLWNNTEFLGKVADINTNAPVTQEQILNLINQYREAQGLEPITVEAQAVGVSGATIEMQSFVAASEGVQDKSATITTDILSMALNTLAIIAYNTATGAMKDKKSTATTSTPSMSSNTGSVKSWNSATGSMSNKSSTATTSVPNTYSNTSAVWGWINALNSAYSRSSTLTTYVDKVYRTFGKHSYAKGGHIGMFAKGGKLSRWAGMFAKGGRVPTGYSGIVGEAGPELFQVTRSGVSITPLSTREKMRGIQGVLEGQSGKKGKGDTTNVIININGGNYRDDDDKRKMAMIIREEFEKIDRRRRRTKGEPRWA